jgi:NADH-quinone oxidoreductase subunit K
LGVIGILRQNQNFLTLLLKIEMMYIGISLYFFGYGYFLFNSAGLAQGLLVLTFAAAETAFGLSLFFYYYLTQQGKALDPVFRYNKRPKYNIKV